jgi:predicted flap endonuclease-1-like 5' DNA nuclease
MVWNSVQTVGLLINERNGVGVLSLALDQQQSAGAPWWIWAIPVLVTILLVAVLGWAISSTLGSVSLNTFRWPAIGSAPEAVARTSALRAQAYVAAPPVTAPTMAPVAAHTEAVATPAPAPVAHAVAPAPEQAHHAPHMDDLTVIEGIGPKIASVIQAAGITTLDKLAHANAQELSQILLDNNLRLADCTTWPEQAKFAAAGDWEGLKQFQEHLKGGRVR